MRRKGKTIQLFQTYNGRSKKGESLGADSFFRPGGSEGSRGNGVRETVEDCPPPQEPGQTSNKSRESPLVPKPNRPVNEKERFLAELRQTAKKELGPKRPSALARTSIKKKRPQIDGVRTGELLRVFARKIRIKSRTQMFKEISRVLGGKKGESRSAELKPCSRK